ncbi:acyltransferase family protein [soil metagenome]
MSVQARPHASRPADFSESDLRPGPVELLAPPPARPPTTAPAPSAGNPPAQPRDEVPIRRRGGRGGPPDLRPRPGHIPGLDGLRGIAILAVLVYHFTPSLLPGGFLGVDVFFVVSGFLITTLLLRELHQHGRIHLGQFWLRRARRLVPALVVVVVLSVAAARVIGGDLLVSIGRQTLGALTFSTNWLEIGAGASYFSATSPLLFVNFWSLAVEEQFYLLWPFGLILTVALTRGTRGRLGVTLGIAAASALAMAVLFVPGQDASRVYYGTDTHAFSLMVGVSLALAWAGPERAWLHTHWWKRWRGLSVTAAFATLIALMATLDDLSSWTFRGGILLAALASVVLIAGLLESGSAWRVAMGVRPLTWLGRRSYGIYLWHWPVLVIALALFPVAPGSAGSGLLLSAALLATLVIAALSYTFVETPIRRHGFLAPLRRSGAWLATPWQQSRTPRLIATALAVVLVLMVAAVLTAPDKSAVQRQIESAQADLEAPAEPNVDQGSRSAAADMAGSPAAVLAGVTALRQAAQGGDVPAAASEEGGSPDGNEDYRKDADGLLVPDGEALTVIGDSLVVTSADGVSYRFPDTNYVAASNRQWKDANEMLEDAVAKGLVRDNVVVHLGTNAGVDEAALREFLDALGPNRRVVVMNLYVRASFTPESNKVIATVAGDYPLVVVGDWNAAAGDNTPALQSDAIHPDIEGMHIYAEVVAKSFDALARGQT